nr:zinc finger, CCHC-type [Tanacetum cinerariifolium]
MLDPEENQQQTKPYGKKFPVLLSNGTTFFDAKGYDIKCGAIGAFVDVAVPFSYGTRSMAPRLNIKKLIENIVQKHEGSKQVGLKQLSSKQVGFNQLGVKQIGFKQLGPSVETGVHKVHDEKRVLFEVELQGAQGNRETEDFWVSSDDAAGAQRRLEDKQLEEKTNTDCLAYFYTVHERNHIFLTLFMSNEYSIANNRNPRVNSKNQWIILTGYPSGIGADMGLQIINGCGYGFIKTRPVAIPIHHGANVGAFIMKTGVPGQEGAKGNAAERDAVACEVIFKWISVMEEDMDTRSSTCMLSNGFRRSSDDNNIYYWKYAPAKEVILGMEIFRTRSGNTLRVSLFRFSNEMSVHILLGGHSMLSLEGGLSENRDKEKKSGPESEVSALVEVAVYRRRLSIITKVEIVRILVCNS